MSLQGVVWTHHSNPSSNPIQPPISHMAPTNSSLLFPATPYVHDGKYIYIQNDIKKQRTQWTFVLIGQFGILCGGWSKMQGHSGSRL